MYLTVCCIQTLTFGPSIHRPIVDSVRGGALVGSCHEVIQTQLHEQFISLGLCDVIHTGYGPPRSPSSQGKAYQSYREKSNNTNLKHLSLPQDKILFMKSFQQKFTTLTHQDPKSRI